MQYVLLIYGDPAAAEGMSEEDGRAMMAEYFEYTEGLRRSGAYVSGRAAGVGADGDHRAAA